MLEFFTVVMVCLQFVLSFKQLFNKKALPERIALVDKAIYTHRYSGKFLFNIILVTTLVSTPVMIYFWVLAYAYGYIILTSAAIITWAASIIHNIPFFKHFYKAIRDNWDR